MKNLFLSPNGLLKNIFNKLDIILAEQRHNRSDIVLVLSLLNKLVVKQNLQKQVDDYFDENVRLKEHLGETSHQTELDEQ